MTTWFQRDVEASRIGNGSFLFRGELCERTRFGVIATEFLVPSFGQDSIAVRDHTSHHGIRFDVPLSKRGQFQGPAHVSLV